MESYRFKSLEELYRKLLPAFRVKVNDLRRHKINYISEKDIWEYLKTSNWTKKQDLTLGEMVNDIITVPNNELINNIRKREGMYNEN